MAFPDVVELVIAYLDPLITPPVRSRVPSNRPPEFVQVRRVGGTSPGSVRDQARLDVFAWAGSDPRAMELQLEVRTALWALAGTNDLGVAVYRVQEFMGPRQDDDPLTGTPRAWATYSLDVRADDAIHLAST